AKLSREEPEAGNLHIRFCEGKGWQHPYLLGKLPWAAGTGYNLQGLSKRGQKPKEERAQRERRMSQYERRRRGKAGQGDGSRRANGGNPRVGERGSGHLVAFSRPYGGRLDKPGANAGYGSGGEAVGKPEVAGVHANGVANKSVGSEECESPYHQLPG